MRYEPMSERSKFGVILSESRGWWECGRQGRVEWTREGRPKAQTCQ